VKHCARAAADMGSTEN